MARVSVIIPIYNVEKYLNRCLDSIINQTYTDIEIILINDGSTDNSGKICDEYKKQDRRIKVLHQKNSGVSYARLNGFNISQGEYVTFVDPDDYLDLLAIEKMVVALEKENVDMVVCQAQEIYESEIKIIIRPKLGYYKKNDIISLLKTNALYDVNTGIAGMSLWLCTKLIKRKYLSSCLKKGLDIIYAEDQIIIISLLYNINTMYVIPDCLYYYNCARSGQATRTYNKKIWENIEGYLYRIIKVDKDNYLTKQIDNRLMISITNFVSIGLKNGNKNIIFNLKRDTNLLDKIHFLDCL